MCKAIVFSIAILAGGTAACGDDNDHEEIEVIAIEQGTTRGQALQAQAIQDLAGCTDAEVISKVAGIVFAINNGEIAQASWILSKTGNPRVRNLANQIIADHQANNAALLALLSSRNLAPAETSVSRTLAGEASAGLAQLQAGEPRNINIDYSQMQISMHKEASLIVGTLHDAMPVSATDVQSFLADTLRVIDKHLAHAETVLRDLP